MQPTSHRRTHSHGLVIITPPGRDQDENGSVVTLSPHVRFYRYTCDGVVVEAPQGVLPVSIAIQSRDCPIVVLWNSDRQKLGVVHLSRDWLVRTLTTTLNQLVAGELNLHARTHAWVSPCISPEYFGYETKPTIVDEITKLGGKAARDRLLPRQLHPASPWPIDLRAAIRVVLEGYGVPAAQVVVSNLCTYAEPRLGSLRAEKSGEPGKKNQNLVLVSPHGD
jgi:copper oxidase (laccase) domain-containing protein